MAGCLLASVSYAGSYTPEPADVSGPHFTSLENAIAHPTIGCGGAVVLTPQPGTQFADPLQNTPGSVTSFYAKAASLNMTWVSTLTCTHTGITHQLGAPGPDVPTPDLIPHQSHPMIPCG